MRVRVLVKNITGMTTPVVKSNARHFYVLSSVGHKNNVHGEYFNRIKFLFGFFLKSSMCTYSVTSRLQYLLSNNFHVYILTYPAPHPLLSNTYSVNSQRQVN